MYCTCNELTIPDLGSRECVCKTGLSGYTVFLLSIDQNYPFAEMVEQIQVIFMMTRSHKYRIPLLVLLIIISLLLQGQSGTPGNTIYLPIIQKTTPPLFATSYYIQNTDPSLMYSLGCDLGARDRELPGKQDSLVILDFGKMWIFKEGEKKEYGVRLFSDGYSRYNITFAELKEAAKQFATGYWSCTKEFDTESQLTLAIGTNNYDSFNTTYTTQDNLRGLAKDFGRNWAYMINDLNETKMSEVYGGQVTFAGAIDIEWGQDSDGVYRWNTPYVTRGWVDEFNAYNNDTSVYFNYGACIGCPIEVSPSWKYNSVMPWTQEDVWYVSWGAQPAYTVPEIYRNDGYLALQWAAISKYGITKYKVSRIVFSGVMTQMQACEQRIDKTDPEDECWTLDNTPEEGWYQLVYALNADPDTVSPYPRWSTDIKWQFK